MRLLLDVGSNQSSQTSGDYLQQRGRRRLDQDRCINTKVHFDAVQAFALASCDSFGTGANEGAVIKIHLLLRFMLDGILLIPYIRDG